MECNNTYYSQFRIYYDGTLKYDARYPIKEHWINQIVKKWWNNKIAYEQLKHFFN